MNEENNSRVAWCPICDQGWVEIAKDKTTKELFVYCTECETEWDSPEYVEVKNKGSFGKYGEIESPTYEEILNKGWKIFILKE